MSARDDILAWVRDALGGTPPAAAPAMPPGTDPADVLGLFCERVADYRAVVERCPADQVALRVRAALPAGQVVVPAGLSIQIAGAVVDDGLSPEELDACVAVVTDAAVGIAETGTIVLDHGPGQGRRAITLVPDVHVCLVRADTVVADVPDAVARLAPAVREGRPLTWISGPSATSDIELDRVEGVHGPRTLHVILVTAELSPGSAELPLRRQEEEAAAGGATRPSLCPVGTMSRPRGSSEMGIILKSAIPSGMPMMVRHSAMPLTRCPIASQIPAKTSQITLPMAEPRPALGLVTTVRPNGHSA